MSKTMSEKDLLNSAVLSASSLYKEATYFPSHEMENPATRAMQYVATGYLTFAIQEVLKISQYCAKKISAGDRNFVQAFRNASELVLILTDILAFPNENRP